MSIESASADAYRHQLTEQLRLADAEVARCERQLEGLEATKIPNKEAALASLRSALEAARAKHDTVAAAWTAAVQEEAVHELDGRLHKDADRGADAA